MLVTENLDSGVSHAVGDNHIANAGKMIDEVGAHMSKITKSAKGEDCALRLPEICCFNPETTVFAHINTVIKGTGTKSLDIHGIYACWKCHDVIDGRNNNHGINQGDLAEYVLDAIWKGDARSNRFRTIPWQHFERFYKPKVTNPLYFQ